MDAVSDASAFLGDRKGDIGCRTGFPGVDGVVQAQPLCQFKLRFVVFDRCRQFIACQVDADDALILVFFGQKDGPGVVFDGA